jgi:hypothetical protein
MFFLIIKNLKKFIPTIPKRCRGKRFFKRVCFSLPIRTRWPSVLIFPLGVSTKKIFLFFYFLFFIFSVVQERRVWCQFFFIEFVIIWLNKTRLRLQCCCCCCCRRKRCWVTLIKALLIFVFRSLEMCLVHQTKKFQVIIFLVFYNDFNILMLKKQKN